MIKILGLLILDRTYIYIFVLSSFVLLLASRLYGYVKTILGNKSDVIAQNLSCFIEMADCS
jgi:hypothetical protein